MNVMSVSFLRASSGEILFFYLLKNSVSDCRVYLRRSTDEGATWSEGIQVSTMPGYNILNNARPIQLSGGRILVPVALSPDIEASGICRAFCYISDDEAATWRRGASDVGFTDTSAYEPGLVELQDGVVLMIIRTTLGRIYHAYSRDAGETWDGPQESPLISPNSPASIARMPSSGDLLIIWNNNPRAAQAGWD